MLGYAAKHLRHPIFRSLFDLLTTQGHHPELSTNEEFLKKSVTDYDVVILKTYHNDTRVIAKAREFELAGKRVINSTRAILAVGDRIKTDENLEKAGLPIPPRAIKPAEIQQLQPPFVRKPRNNYYHDISFITSKSDVVYDPDYYYQQVVPNDGYDRKLYIIREHVFLVSRPASHVQDFDKKLKEDRVKTALPAEWGEWAMKIGTLTGLQVYGVDLVGQGTAFYIIDVNPFPGFIGVPEAPQLLANLILQ